MPTLRTLGLAVAVAILVAAPAGAHTRVTIGLDNQGPAMFDSRYFQAPTSSREATAR